MANPLALPLTAPDLVCLDDLDPFASETTSDLQSLEQDVYHILIETAGSNPDDETRGIGVEQLLSSSASNFTMITQIIDTQLSKDDRIDTCTSTLTSLPPGSTLPDGTPLPDGGYLLELDIVPDESVLGSSDVIALAFGYSGSGGLTPQ